jgi:hypothetical protein
VLGDGHPDTLRAQGNLALTLSALGELDRARQLQEDVLAGFRRVLGDDRPTTLMAQGNLAATLRVGLGRRLQEDVLARCRRVLCDDHPHTLTAQGRLPTLCGSWASWIEPDQPTLQRRDRRSSNLLSAPCRSS